MKFSKFQIILIILFIVVGTYLLLNNGSRNTPYNLQSEYSEVPLTKDPESPSPLFDFDFEIPEIPFLDGLFGLGSGGILLIILFFFVLLILFIGSLVISYRQTKKSEETIENDIETKDSVEIHFLRRTLGTRIEEIIAFLNDCLQNESYDQGISEGFEHLDRAMKEYSKISRPGWLTPREYANLEIPYFNQSALLEAVEQFYRINYGKKLAYKADLVIFIARFNEMISDRKILSWKADTMPKEEDS
jgi:cbb3-type cytochrome oxidase subunit 3